MTNEELTTIYNEANGLDPKRHNPITTERIFAAMLAGMVKEREACAISVEAERLEGPIDNDGDAAYNTALEHAAKAIRMRSNVL